MNDFTLRRLPETNQLLITAKRHETIFVVNQNYGRGRKKMNDAICKKMWGCH